MRAVTVRRVVESEAIKLWTLRSYSVAIVVSAVMLTVIAYFMADVTADEFGLAGGAIAAQPVALPMEYLAYVWMVIGVLIVSADHESGTGTITASLVPSRLTVLLGKYVLIVSVGLGVALLVLLMVMASVAWGGEVALTEMHGIEDGWWGITSDVAAVPLAGLIGASVAVLVRSGAVAIALLLLWSMAAETLLVFIVDEKYGSLLPFKVIGGSRSVMDVFTPAEGIGLFALYAAAAVVAAIAFRRTSKGMSA